MHIKEPERGYSGSAINNFSDANIRRGFIKKVYLIVSTMLAISFGIIFAFVLSESANEFMKRNRWLIFLCLAVYLITAMIIICCKNIRRKVPFNFILLTAITVSMSLVMGTTSSYYDTNSFLIAFGITAVIVIGLTVFAATTKLDFTSCQMVLFVILLTFILFSIGLTITYQVAPIDKRTHYILQMVYASIGALIFSIYLVVDTQMIMGGRSEQISEEDYILGALMLWIDIIQMFTFILQIVGNN